MKKKEQMGDSDSRIQVPRFVQSEQNGFYFTKMGEIVHLRQDQLLAVPGTCPHYCYFIRSGRVIAGTLDRSGNQRILLSFGENTLLLEQYLLTGKPSDLFYKVVENATAQKITYHDLTQAMKTNFSVTLDVLNAISDLGALAHQRQRSESETGARQKVCNQFLDFALVYGVNVNGQVLIQEKITQEKIGSLTGLHRITVTREIKKMKDCGILQQKEGLYSITSLEELVAYRDANEEKTGDKEST